jgi:hypothetical protein
METKQMSHLEFREACYRNLAVCQMLLNTYSASSKTTHKKSILHKTYYLGGYVIEFAIKYSLFSHLKKSIRLTNVYEWENKEWHNHDFSKLKNIATKNGLIYSQDIPFLGNRTNLSEHTLNLIDNWDVQIRYSLKLNKSKHTKRIGLSIQNLTEYIECVQQITDLITTKYK